MVLLYGHSSIYKSGMFPAASDICPNITLNGDSTITVYTNTIFDDENATAYDFSYGSITITGTTARWIR